MPSNIWKAMQAQFIVKKNPNFLKLVLRICEVERMEQTNYNFSIRLPLSLQSLTWMGD